jgi:hypothetical protein
MRRGLPERRHRCTSCAVPRAAGCRATSSVKPLDGTVDHELAWITVMSIDLIITAVLYKAVYHGHQVT